MRRQSPWTWMLPLLPLLARAQAEEPEHVYSPPPDFTSGYKLPPDQAPLPYGEWLAWVDVTVLLVMLTLAALCALRWRSRKGMFALALVSILYFGVYRHGCICAVGSIGNVGLAIANHAYVLPLAAGIIFLAPLVFALFVGRAFCAGVCPLGALQDVLLLKPVKLPAWLQGALGVLPFVYLGTALTYIFANAVTPLFIICQYDPFVAFFRGSGSQGMLIFGGIMLGIGLFVGRPYCRFLCPYSALLRLLAPFAKWRVRITPTECNQCRLCEDACPFGAIKVPTPEPVEGKRQEGKRRLAYLLVLLPILVAGGAFLGQRASGTLALLDPTVRTARIVIENRQINWEERQAQDPKTKVPDELKALDGKPKQEEALYERAQQIVQQFRLATTVLGGWTGFVLGLALIGLSLRRKRTEYEADPANCVACGRCFAVCPYSHKKTEIAAGEAKQPVA